MFLIGLGLYVLNQLVLKQLFAVSFLHQHLNDCLLIACALPPVLWGHEQLGLREAGRPPSVVEVIGHLLVWSVLMEWLGPMWMSWTTADPMDIVAYWAGGFVALAWWQRHRVGQWLQAAPRLLWLR